MGNIRQNLLFSLLTIIGISETLDPLLEQTHKDWGCIVVDDGSTNEPPEIIRSYKEERTKYLRHKNEGLPDALNTSFAKATGEAGISIRACWERSPRKSLTKL